MARRKTKLKVKTTGDKVLVNTPASVYGKVSGPKRKVMLQLKNAYGWRTIDKDKSNKSGRVRAQGADQVVRQEEDARRRAARRAASRAR